MIFLRSVLKVILLFNLKSLLSPKVFINSIEILLLISWKKSV